MNFNDRTKPDLLQRMSSTEPTGTVADVPAVTATDRSEALELTVDAVRRVISVQVRDLAALRSTQAFTSALIGAFQIADGQRALAALEHSGDLNAFLNEVERNFAENPGLRLPPSIDVSYAAYRAGRLEHGRTDPQEQPPARTSDNGYLTVQRGAAGDLLTVDVDEEWLLGVRVEHLESAIEQAMTITWDGE